MNTLNLIRRQIQKASAAVEDNSNFVKADSFLYVKANHTAMCIVTHSHWKSLSLTLIVTLQLNPRILISMGVHILGHKPTHIGRLNGTPSKCRIR